MLRQLLSEEHEVQVAYTGQEAIDRGLKFEPKLIISDWNLKDDIDGVVACKRILEHSKAIIIFASGSPIEQLREVAAALTPLHILSKPLDLDNLCALIKKVQDDCNHVV